MESVFTSEGSLFATPTKKMKHCLACDKATHGHVRSLKNVAMKIIYDELLSVLNVDLPKETQGVFLCDACIRAVQKIIEMRIVCKRNLSAVDRQKRIIPHSTSPNIKKQHNLQPSRSSSTKVSRRTVFIHTPQEPSVTHSESHDKGDHSYAGSNSEGNVSDLYIQHKVKFFGTSVIDEHEQQKVLENVSSCSNVDSLLTTLLKNSYVNKSVWKMYLLNLHSELDRVCGTKCPSVLRTKLTDLDAGVFLDEIVKEIHTRCPRVFDVLNVLTCPLLSAVPKDSHAISAMYAMATYSRNPQLIAFQRLITASCMRYNAGNGLLGILNRCGISVPEKSKIPLVNGLSEGNDKGVSDALRDGRSRKITVDHNDARIKAYQVKMINMDVIEAVSKKNGMCVACGKSSIKNLSQNSCGHADRKKYLTDLLWRYGDIRVGGGYLCRVDERRLLSLEKKARLFRESCQKTKNDFMSMASLGTQVLKQPCPSTDSSVKDYSGIAQHNNKAVTSSDKKVEINLKVTGVGQHNNIAVTSSDEIDEINLKNIEVKIEENESEMSDDNDFVVIENVPEDTSDMMEVKAEHETGVTKEVERTGQHGTERLKESDDVTNNNFAVFDETEIGMNEITSSLKQSEVGCNKNKKRKVSKSKRYAEESEIGSANPNDIPRESNKRKAAPELFEEHNYIRGKTPKKT